MGEFPIGGEDIGILDPVFLDFIGFLKGDEGELAFSALEFLGMEDVGAGATRLQRPLFAIVAEIVPCNAGEKGHDAGDFLQHAVGAVVGLGITHAIHDVDDDLAVGSGTLQGLADLAHPLYPPFPVGEGTILFEGAGTGEYHRGHSGGFGHEDLLTDQEFDPLQGLSDLIGVGIGLQNVLPDDPQGLEPAVDGRLHHLGALVSHPVRDAFHAIKGVVFSMDVGKGHVEIPRTLVGLATHVGSALYIVLTAQGIDARAGLADVTGNHGEPGDDLNGGRTLSLLGDPEAMEFHGGRGGGVGMGGLLDQSLIDAGDARHFVHIDPQDLSLECLPPFHPGIDEALVHPSLAHDVVQHHVQERHIGAGAQLQVVPGVSGEFDLSGVDDDTGDALHEFLLDPGPGDGVGIGGIGADDQDAVGGIQIGDGIGGGTGAEGALQAQGGGRMTHPRAAIDVVGADDRAHEFLHEVVFFIGGAGRRDAGDGVRAVFLFDALEFGNDMVIGRVPGYFPKSPIIAFDHGGAQAIRVIEKSEGIPPLEARVAAVDLGIEGRPDGDYLVMGGRDIQVATDAAIGAHGPGYLVGLGRLGLEYIGDGCRGAGCRAGATTDAIGFREGPIHSLGDMAVEPPARHGKHELPLHLVAGPHAPVTMDAFGQIGTQIGMGGVFAMVTPLPCQMIATAGIPDLPDSRLGRHPLQLAIAVRLAGETIQGVVGEDQLDDIAPQAPYIGGMGVDILAFLDRRMTGGHHAAGGVFVRRHLHRAEPTRTERGEIGGMAEGGDVVVSGAPGELENGFAGGYGEGGVVDVGCGGHGFYI